MSIITRYPTGTWWIEATQGHIGTGQPLTTNVYTVPHFNSAKLKKLCTRVKFLAEHGFNGTVLIYITTLRAGSACVVKLGGRKDLKKLEKGMVEKGLEACIRSWYQTYLHVFSFLNSSNTIYCISLATDPLHSHFTAVLDDNDTGQNPEP